MLEEFGGTLSFWGLNPRRVVECFVSPIPPAGKFICSRSCPNFNKVCQRVDQPPKLLGLSVLPVYISPKLGHSLLLPAR